MNRPTALAIAISAALLSGSPASFAGKTNSSTAKLPEIHKSFLLSIVLLLKNPDDMSVETLKRSFPGDYKTEDCPNSYTACAFTNKTESSSPVVLRTFQLNNPNVSSAFRSNLYFDISESPCLKKQIVDSYLGLKARKSEVQPPLTVYKEEEVIPYEMECTNIKTANTTTYIRIMLTHDCATNLTMNFYPN